MVCSRCGADWGISVVLIVIPTLHWQDRVAAVVDDLISLSVVAVVVAADAMVSVVAQAY